MTSCGVNSKTLLCVKLDSFFSCVFAIWIFLCLTFFCIAWINKYHSIPLCFWFHFLSYSVLYPIWVFQDFFSGEHFSIIFCEKLLHSCCWYMVNWKIKTLVLHFLQFNKKFISNFALLTLRYNFLSSLSLLIGSTPPYLFEMS